MNPAVLEEIRKRNERKKHLQKTILFTLSAVLALIVSLRAFGSEIVSTAIFTFIIYSAVIATAIINSNARRNINGHH